MYSIFLSPTLLGLPVPLSEKNADQSDGVPERQERASVHGRAVGAAAERAGLRQRHPRGLHPAEEGGDQEAVGGEWLYGCYAVNMKLIYTIYNSLLVCK